jgi:hypothetical protein
MTMFVGCRQFLGIVEAGTQFRYLKKQLLKQEHIATWKTKYQTSSG